MSQQIAKPFYRLIQGDCLKVLPKLETQTIDMIVTDPPYGFGRFATDTEDYTTVLKWAFVEMKRLLKRGGFAFVFTNTSDIVRLANLIPLNFQRLLWMYKPNDCTFPWRGWLLTSEAIMVFTSGEPKPLAERKPYQHDCYIHKNVGNEGVEGHPTVKPIKVVTDLVSRSNPNSIILDPFLGSGTTMKACQDLKRSCIGIEIEPKYCEIIRERCFGRTFLDHEVEYDFQVFDEGVAVSGGFYTVNEAKTEFSFAKEHSLRNGEKTS